MTLQALLAFAVLALPMQGAQEARSLTLRWHGQSLFEIESSQGTRIVTDPHAIPMYGKREYAADIVTISHQHTDHSLLGVIKTSPRTKVFNGIKTSGKQQDWVPVNEKVRDVSIRTVGVYHDEVQGLERGKNTVFVLEVDGLRIVHLGDLGHVLNPQQVKQIGPVDVLLIPVGGIYTINGSEAKAVVAQLKPRLYVIPMHYGTKAFNDLLGPDEFLEELPNVKRFLTNKLTIGAESTASAPTIAVLDYKNN